MCSQHKLLLAGGDQKNTCEYAAGILYVRDLSREECVEQRRSSIEFPCILGVLLTSEA